AGAGGCGLSDEAPVATTAAVSAAGVGGTGSAVRTRRCRARGVGSTSPRTGAAIAAGDVAGARYRIATALEQDAAARSAACTRTLGSASVRAVGSGCEQRAAHRQCAARRDLERTAAATGQNTGVAVATTAATHQRRERGRTSIHAGDASRRTA